MSACERPKSAWKSRSRTPHYTSWEGDPEGGRHTSAEPPPREASQGTTTSRRKTVSLTDDSGSQSDRRHRADDASGEGKAGRQRHPPETKTHEAVDSDRSKKTDRQKRKTGIQQDSLDPLRKSEDVSKTIFQKEEITRRDSKPVSFVEEARRPCISTHRRERSWYETKDGPFCDVRIMSREVKGLGVDGGGGERGEGGSARRLYINPKPSKLAPLNLTRPSDGLAMQGTTDMMSRSWMPERGTEHSLICGDLVDKRSDANRKSKLTPLPGLRKDTDAEEQQDHRQPYK